MEDDSRLLELPEDDVQEHLHARKQQCIQHARRKEARYCFIHSRSIVLLCHPSSRMKTDSFMLQVSSKKLLHTTEIQHQS